MIKTILADLMFRLGRMHSNPRLLNRACRLDPHSLRAPLQLAKCGDPGPAGLMLLKTLYALREHALAHPSQEESQAFLRLAIDHLKESRSQCFQDVAAWHFSGQKRDGFFVEVGTGNGEQLSNTFMLEKSFSWRGVLFEPDRRFHESIRHIRSATLDPHPAYSQDHVTLQFLEVGRAGELSTLLPFRRTDGRIRRGTTYDVQTTTLNSALQRLGAPREVDYISIDTEGSEMDVLKGLDLNYYRVRFLTIEHNYVKGCKESLVNYLRPYGYRPVFEQFSAQDVWLIRDVAQNLQGESQIESQAAMRRAA